MKSHFFSSLLLFNAFVVCSQSVSAQAADVVPLVHREKIVLAANKLIQDRSLPPLIPAEAPNPFVWPAEQETKEMENAVAAMPTVSGPDLLTRLALRIPATGTVSLGGSPILLLGQKRLKVGDSLTISFEGQNYDITIEAIAPSSFTVRRGDSLYSRPVHLPQLR